ncbi:uncharacterized mitochondrial protein-like protein [Tanacetum coccineum]
MNKLVKGNLVRGLPSKLFENDQTYVACQKGKQHRASCKSKTENSISLPLHLLHMDLFGPTFVKSLMKKMYCLVVTNDYSRFTWVFFLATKDETSGILKSFITGIENLVDHKVKVIRCDNGTEFKNKEMNQFCEMKGILRQFSVARTPQQNGVAERRNKTLIEAARTMLADSKLPTTFWAEAVNTACYVHSLMVLQSSHDDGSKPSSDDGKKVDEDPRKESECNDQEKEDNVNSTNNVNAAGTNKHKFDYSRDDEDDGAVADINNLDTTIQVSPIPTTRIHKDHPLDQVIGDLQSATQTRKMSKNLEEHGFEEPKKVIHALKDPSWIEAMQEELLQFKIEEEVYVCQPPGFEDPDFPDRVYKVEKALYGLHQAPRAWYETLSTYLLDNGFQRGKIDKTLFIKRHKDEFYGRTYILLRFIEVKTASTPVKTQKPLLMDEDGKEVDVHIYRSMIGSLMYLTSSRPDIMYLKGKPKLGLWYPKDSPFDLVAYIDSDYTGSSLDRKSTIGGCQFLGCKLISWHCKKQTVVANSTTEAEYVAASSCFVNAGDSKLMLLDITYYCWVTTARLWRAKTANREVQLQALVYGKKIIITKSIIKRDLQLEDAKGVDCIPNATIFEQLTLMGTMASAIICLATNQKFNFSKYIFESMVKNLDNVSVNFLMYPRNMRRVGKGFSRRETPLFQTMIVQDQEEVGEGSEMITNPHHTPTIIQLSTSQPQKKQRSRRSKRKDTKVPQPSGLTTNVADEAVNEQMDDSFERATTTATGLEAERQETMRDTTAQTRSENVSKLSNDPLIARGNTLQSGEDRLKLEELMALCTTLQSRVLALETTKTTQATKYTSLKKRVKKLERKNKSRTHGLKRLYRVSSSRRVESSEDEGLDGDDVIVESVDVDKTAEETRNMVEEVTVVTIPVKIQDKGKGKWFEPEPMNKISKKELLKFDEELAFKLQAKEEKEERLAREKAQQVEEANIAWDDVQAKINVDYQLAQRLVNTFVDYITELLEESSKKAEAEIANESSLKRAGEELEQESSKKQKVDDDKETTELKSLMEVIPYESKVFT